MDSLFGVDLVRLAPAVESITVAIVLSCVLHSKMFRSALPSKRMAIHQGTAIAAVRSGDNRSDRILLASFMSLPMLLALACNAFDCYFMRQNLVVVAAIGWTTTFWLGTQLARAFAAQRRPAAVSSASNVDALACC